MYRYELTDEVARMRLAGFVRNHLVGSGTIFTPWNGLDLTVQQGMLYQVTPQGKMPVATVEDLLTMDDAAIEQAVLGGNQ